VSPDDCPNCGGTGYVAKPVDLNGKSDGVAFIRMKCTVCAGTGRKRPIPPTTAGWPHGLRCLRKRTGPEPPQVPPWKVAVRAGRHSSLTGFI